MSDEVDDGLEWFPCKPAKLLGALSGMKPPKKLTYLIVLLRIYEEGGACPDSIEAISLRVGLNKRIVTDALAELYKEQRLYTGEGGIRNWKADSVISTSLALRERRKSAAAEAANSRWEKSKKNQSKADADRTANAVPFDAQLQEQDSLFSIENRVPPAAPARPKPKAAPRPAAEPPPDDGWPSDYLEQFWTAFPPYRLAGKAKVGEKLARLRRDKTVTWADLIGGVRRYAATNPGEYAAGPMPWLNGAKWDGVYEARNGGTANGENRNNRGPRIGAAGIAHRLRQSIEQRERDGDSSGFFAADDHESDDGHRNPPPTLGRMDRTGPAASSPPGPRAFGAGGPRGA